MTDVTAAKAVFPEDQPVKSGWVPRHAPFLYLRTVAITDSDVTASIDQQRYNLRNNEHPPAYLLMASTNTAGKWPIACSRLRNSTH